MNHPPALDETNRRRDIQIKYNEEHGIQPISIFKEVRDLTDQITVRTIAEPSATYSADSISGLPQNELKKVTAELEKEMKTAAKDLEFEKAAILRDQVFELRSMLADESNAPPWERIKLLAGED